jgi:hypothetical protein
MSPRPINVSAKIAEFDSLCCTTDRNPFGRNSHMMLLPLLREPWCSLTTPSPPVRGSREEQAKG